MSDPCASHLSIGETFVVEKTAKIKHWVKNRLQELEKQDERLRVQNLKCTAQLKVLDSCADRTRVWQNSLIFSHSAEKFLSAVMDRVSDDSGLNSDDTWEKKIDVMTKSVTTFYDNASPRHPRKPVRLRSSSQYPNDDADGTSSTTDSSPWEEKLKPVPTPRATKRIVEINKQRIERDSLNSYEDENDYKDEEDEIFDEIDLPQSPNDRKTADYVNLNEMFLIGNSSSTCESQNPPALPMHRPPNLWETRLYQTADRCLSSVINDDQVSQCCAMISKSSLIDNTSDLCSSPSRGSKGSSRSSNRRRSQEMTVIKESDYYIPPDASHNVRATIINTEQDVEKCGYLMQVSDNRLKSLKRRYFVLKNGYITLYRTQKNFVRNEEPAARIAISEILSLTKIPCKTGQGLQIVTANNRFCYNAESERITNEWFKAISQSMRANTISEVSQRVSSLNTVISGYVLKAKCGSSRRLFASIVDNKLLFFKNIEDWIPCSHIFLKGAVINEKTKKSCDEYSGSSDEQNENTSSFDSGQFISIELHGSDPIYIALKDEEQKQRWIYYLKKSAGNLPNSYTAFESIVQKMMNEVNIHESSLWQDSLLTSCEERKKEPLMTINDELMFKKAVELGRACYLFTSVLMRPTGVQYHIDLAQNILSTSISDESLKNELYANLIKLTSCSMAYRIQAWKLLALTCPLFSPRQYILLWLLRRHIERWMLEKSDEGKLATYCDRALNRCLKEGGRLEGPSKIEVVSILTRDPTSTKMPHSIPVLLPNGDYYVIDFDGSTNIANCLSIICIRYGLRSALICGYALYMEDTTDETSYTLLRDEQKLCDCLSRWERNLVSNKSGRVTEESAKIRLVLRQRQYWSHLEAQETVNERIFLVHHMANEIVNSHIPMSTELAEELAAIYAQMQYGDLAEPISNEHFSRIRTKYYPRKMLNIGCERTLKLNIMSHWAQLRGTSPQDCVRMILSVLRRWRFFGSYIHEAKMKMHNDESIFIALNDQGVHILNYKQLDPIRSFPYRRLVSFGGYHNDFMLTVERVLPPEAHPEETARERLTFSMSPKAIDQLTCHLAEYIRCHKFIRKLSNRRDL